MGNVDLDLDALAPKPKTIKFNGKEIVVEQPSMRQVAKLMLFGQKYQEAMANINTAETDDQKEQKMEELLNNLTIVLKEIIVELKDATLSSGQVLALMGIIFDMINPEQYKELEKKGIKVEIDASKKVPAA